MAARIHGYIISSYFSDFNRNSERFSELMAHEFVDADVGIWETAM